MDMVNLTFSWPEYRLLTNGRLLVGGQLEEALDDIFWEMGDPVEAAVAAQFPRSFK